MSRLSGRTYEEIYGPERAADIKKRKSESLSRAFKKKWARGDFDNRINGMTTPEGKAALSQAIADKWARGEYDRRIDGMLGRSRWKNPNWKPEGYYREAAIAVHGEVCLECGRGGEDYKINVHHVDEDYGNFLLTNLIPLCVPCHAFRYHGMGGHPLAPFVTIGKEFEFDYAHLLPWHEGKCANLHGHRGKILIECRRRLNGYGIVTDFADLKEAVSLTISEVLDHQFLNDILTNPTAELTTLYLWSILSKTIKGIVRIRFWETPTSYAELTTKDVLSMFEQFNREETK